WPAKGAGRVVSEGGNGSWGRSVAQRRLHAEPDPPDDLRRRHAAYHHGSADPGADGALSAVRSGNSNSRLLVLLHIARRKTMNDKSKHDTSKDASRQRNEGEGNRTAARQYNEAQRR